MQWRIAGLSLAVSILAGCGGEPVPPSEPQALEWREASLAAQPALDRLRERIPSDLGYTPGTTEWRITAIEQEAREASAGSPGRLLQKVALALGDGDFLGSEAWEQTLRVWQHNTHEAVGVILYWGYKDDSLAGRDLRLTMTLADDRWQPTELEERFQCRRGVANGLCL